MVPCLQGDLGPHFPVAFHGGGDSLHPETPCEAENGLVGGRIGPENGQPVGGKAQPLRQAGAGPFESLRGVMGEVPGPELEAMQLRPAGDVDQFRQASKGAETVALNAEGRQLHKEAWFGVAGRKVPELPSGPRRETLPLRKDASIRQANKKPPGNFATSSRIIFYL